MVEFWKDINDYEGLYQVSNLGRVKSLTRILKDGRKWEEKIIKPGNNGHGYLQVNLHKNGKQKNFFIHRLVAEAFIPNPDNLPYVNHKDEDKTNNLVSNIEWCTHEYNINYGTRNERASKTMSGVYNTKKSKTVLQLRKNGSLVRVWPSASEVERQLQFNQGSISKCCLGERHSAYGYKWCYANNK